MKKCKNPECQKEIMDNMNYCSEQCVKRHIEIKDSERRKRTIGELQDESTIDEIRQVMNHLGRGFQDGYVKGTHLSQILMYMRSIRTEKMRLTLAKMALICSTSQRNLRENYFSGLEAFGVIDVKVIGHDVVWFWVGAKAFDNGTKIPESLINLTDEQTAQKDDESND